MMSQPQIDALTAVAEQAGLRGIDLEALARVLDAAQRVAASAERSRIASLLRQRGQEELARVVEGGE